MPSRRHFLNYQSAHCQVRRIVRLLALLLLRQRPRAPCTRERKKTQESCYVSVAHDSRPTWAATRGGSCHSEQGNSNAQIDRWSQCLSHSLRPIGRARVRRRQAHENGRQERQVDAAAARCRRRHFKDRRVGFQLGWLPPGARKLLRSAIATAVSEVGPPPGKQPLLNAGVNV